MRKQTGFAIAAAIMMGLAATFWTITSVATRGITPTPYPSVKELKPFY
jgi:hypothetical protein